tara:strand:+ start:4667 stop:6253 length:1587 start_codon:yes stop_codon:yes gene_type:complete
MATSIEQSLNWRNVSTKPDYQVAARRVDTFVQPERNTRGAQIAQALGQAAGGFNTLANKKEALVKQAQAKATAQANEQVSLLEAMTAKTEAAKHGPNVVEFMKTYDLGLVDGGRPSLEQTWADFNTAHPTYATALNNLQTLKGKVALSETIGVAFNKNYSESLIARERLDEDNALNNNILINLESIPYDSQSIEFTQLMKGIDGDLMGFGRSPQEAYTTLGNVASIAARERGDFRVYDYLLGDAKGGKAIGGVKEREAWLKEKNTIKNQQAQQRNQRNTEIADKLKADKVLLAQEAVALFNTDAPVTSEQEIALTQKYIEQGVPNAASLVKTMGANFKAMKQVTLTAEQESKVWEGFIAAGTPDNQRNFIQAQVAKKTISKGLMSQLYSRLGNANDQSLLSGSWYTAHSAGITRLTQSEGFAGALVEDSKYSYLKPLFQQRYLQMATTPEWDELDLQGKYDAMAGLIQSMETLKEINKDDDPSNDMQQLQKIQTGRIVPDQVALDQWEIHNQDPKFLEMWDKKYDRPK